MRANLSIYEALTKLPENASIDKYGSICPKLDITG
jgi:hypothetical protein